MAAQATGNSTFSQCSLDQMAVVIEDRVRTYPSCLVPLTDYDVGIVAPGPVAAQPGAMIDLTIVVQNVGTQPASAVNLRLTTPSQLVVSAINNDLGSCDFGPKDVSCDLASLAVATSWTVHVQVSSDVARRYSVTTSVSATTDSDMTNNLAQFSVTVGDVSGGSGGGGSLDWSGLAMLALAVACRLRLTPQNWPIDARLATARRAGDKECAP